MNDEARIEMWRQRVSDCKISELPVRRWCKEHDINVSTFYKWKNRIAVLDGEREPTDPVKQEAPEWMQIIPVEETTKELATSKPSDSFATHLRVNIGNASIEVYPGFDAGLLRKVVEVLHSC